MSMGNGGSGCHNQLTVYARRVIWGMGVVGVITSELFMPEG